jgi:hypothetical protein
MDKRRKLLMSGGPRGSYTQLRNTREGLHILRKLCLSLCCPTIEAMEKVAEGVDFRHTVGPRITDEFPSLGSWLVELRDT